SELVATALPRIVELGERSRPRVFRFAGDVADAHADRRTGAAGLRFLVALAGALRQSEMIDEAAGRLAEALTLAASTDGLDDRDRAALTAAVREFEAATGRVVDGG
ncbi:MAG: hypothetical protein KAI24_11980, partial [Planctomycetes bacterium]|nr:hypothetical protein [Planctomycetota bacterium]